VSSLYTFPLLGLARRWHRWSGAPQPEAFAEFTEVLRSDFSGRDPVGSFLRMNLRLDGADRSTPVGLPIHSEFNSCQVPCSAVELWALG
jgi:hypothetical protein